VEVGQVPAVAEDREAEAAQVPAVAASVRAVEAEDREVEAGQVPAVEVVPEVGVSEVREGLAVGQAVVQAPVAEPALEQRSRENG